MHHWAAWSGRNRPRNECRKVQTCLTAQVPVHVFNCSSYRYIHLTAHSDCVRFTQRCVCSRARAHIGKIHTHTKTHSAIAYTYKHTYACAHHEHTNDRIPCPHLRCLPAHACKCTQLHTYIHTKTYVHLRQVLRQRKFAYQQYRYGLISFFSHSA
jgi:hypothetical protein